MADQIAPFRPSPPAFCLNGSTPVQSAAFVGMTGDWSLLVYNRSQSQDAYLSYGPTSTVVTANTIPTPGGAPVNTAPNAAGGVIPIPQGSLQVFTFSGPTFLCALVASGNAQLDCIAGDGS